MPLQPFRYEYGYLCFRIPTIAFGVCFLQRAKVFDAALARMRAEPETELLVVFSEEVSQLVCTLISDDQGIDRCDWMLGLRAPKRSFGPPQTPFAVGHGPMELMNMPSSGQKYFAKVMGSTYSPSILGVLCLCWRYVNLCQDRVIENNEPYLVSMFCLTYFRYCLVSPAFDGDVLVLMYDRNPELWGKAKQSFIDDQDERDKYLSYDKRSKPTDVRWFSQLSVSLMPIILQFLLSRVPDGIEGLLPRLFGLTIDRLWEARLGNQVSCDELIKIAADTMTFLGCALECLIEKKYLDQSMICEIIDVLIRHDLFDFIAQTAFSLPIRPKGLPRMEDPNMKFIEQSVWMWERVGKILPKKLLRSKFLTILPDLQKYIAMLFNGRTWEKTLQYAGTVFIPCLSPLYALAMSSAYKTNCRMYTKRRDFALGRDALILFKGKFYCLRAENVGLRIAAEIVWPGIGCTGICASGIDYRVGKYCP
ncbi:unnamed protein product [Rhizoctonia solani]|uniref:Uncharacterized protein n=1 Tax=Rhizoctonia solani TaxID=456999 RepID=A0A8H3H9N5_9AGAM|nr:unnamed protein product [Rhizoctonia solani]